MAASLNLFISIKIGSRTDIVALFLGIMVYELYISVLDKTILKKLILFSILGLVVLSLLIVLEQFRSAVSDDTNLAKMILFKDYYAPGHILIASMFYDIVDPINVILSNLYNSLVLMNYPYLQTEIGNKLIEGSSSRSTGYAMYIFSEGFLFAGWYGGFVYNGIIVSLGIILWRCMSRSNYSHYNAFIIGLTSTQLANMARSQSMYFIKDIYMIFVIAIILYYLITGFRPQFLRKRVK
ncbi:hypothetical protein N5S76_10545 [Aliarcobacter cryaerophilus]|nr:hypothetical protein [Aliarcobacter cryaerophilus]